MSFQSDIQKFVKKTGANMDEVFQKVAFDISKSVIKRTPVDSGRLKGNWQSSISSAKTGTLERLDKSGNASTSEAQAVIGGLKAGDTFFIVNNLPYAKAIEEGHSPQAPQGMVRLTVLEYKQMIRRAVRALK